MTALSWLFHSDYGLLARVAIGGGVFALLAARDLLRQGRKATRWREYAVLLAAVVAALAFGVVNDQVTVTISPEYFLYGKELAKTVGDPPASAAALRWGAAKVGMMATWSAGLLFGVVLLLANNPWRDVPRLPNRRLVGLLPLILLTAAVTGTVGGLLGYAGGLTHLSGDFEDLVKADLWRPRRFMATWGVHLGDYVGGLLGTGLAATVVLVRRRQARRDVGPRPAQDRPGPITADG